jgi:type I restriction enzyme S subunit
MMLLNLDLLATAPGGVARLRELILTLAVQGKLVAQDTGDEPASELLKRIRVEKDRLIAGGKIKKDKPLAAIAEGEKPFELPVGWEWERFGSIAGIERGGSPRPIESFLTDDPTGLNWIKIGDTEKGGKYITSASQKIKREGLVKTRMVFPGDFLLTNSMSFGRPYITQIEGCIHDGWLRISPPTSLNKDFLYVLLSSRFIRTVFEAAAAGGVVLNLNADKVRTVPIPLPPLPEQSRIVTRVEELMRLCDALEAKGRLEAAQHAQLVTTLLGTLTESDTPEQLAENWHRLATHFDLLLDRPQAVDALEQTILQLAVRGLLVPQDPTDEPASALLKKIRLEKDRLIAAGQIKRDKPLAVIGEDEQPFALPVGWVWTHVSDVVEMLNGYAFKSEWFKQTGVRLLRNLNVSHGYVDWSQPAAIDANAATEFQQFALQVGDTVLSLDRPIISTGLKYAVIRESDLPCLLLQRVARMAPETKLVSSEFLVLWLQSDLFVGTIDPGRSNGVPHISTKQVGGLALPLPPLPEQSRIVTRVAQLRRLCADLRQRLTASQSTQAQLAEALVENVA